MAVEIFEQVPDVDVILVPTGGGGLLAGVSVAIKALKPETEVSTLVKYLLPANVANTSFFCYRLSPLNQKWFRLSGRL